MTFSKANTITALLFLVIHYPLWIYHETFFNFGTHVYVFLIGLLFGFVYKRTGSLWSVVILHVFHKFTRFQDRYNVDEIMVVSYIYDPDKQVRSYEILKEVVEGR